MQLRPRDRLVYVVERLMLRGAGWRLLVIAAAVAAIAIIGGALVVASGEHFGSFGAAVWWAFLRLTDPGYLGDDVGTWRRVVSTVLTVLGYVIFLGALIAVMTQWLQAFMRNLELGVTPILKEDHVLILGWTERTPIIVRELLLSGSRVRRFLLRHDARSLDIVILAAEVGPELVLELRDALGDRYDRHRIILRTGTPLRLAHLERVDFLRAAVIVVPGVDVAWQGGGTRPELTISNADTMAIKILLSIATHAREHALAVTALPQVVVEMSDARKALVAENAYPGSVEVVASDLIVCRLMAQNVRNPGLSHVATELLTHSHGNQIFASDQPDAVGRTLGELTHRFPEALVLGVVRKVDGRMQSMLGARPDLPIEPGDRLVLMARDFEGTALAAAPHVVPELAGAASAELALAPRAPRRVLMLGWSHRVPPLLAEFAAYPREHFTIDVCSAIPAAERARELARGPAWPTITVRQLERDFTVPGELAAIAPAEYDNVILLGSNWLDSREAADSRTVLANLLLRDLVPAVGRPDVLVELLDPTSEALVEGLPGEVLITPEIVSHIMAQVTLRPELGSVFDELFGPAGAETHFIPAPACGLVGRKVTFADAMAAAASIGGVAMGFRRGGERRTPTGGVYLNPPRAQLWTLADDDDVIILIDT
ncbi:MAG: TrkA C-terminal domain-containing protein [Kofleriaceae bacterium]